MSLKESNIETLHDEAEISEQEVSISAETAEAISEQDSSLNDEHSEENEALSVSGENKKVKIRMPMIIAAGVVMVTVVICTMFGLFFHRSFKNNGWEWHISVEGDDPAELTYHLRFGEDNLCELMMGGTTYKGKYKTTYDNGKNKISFIFTEVGNEIFHGDCYYELTGNALSEQYLYLTDLDGFILSPETPETVDSEDAAFKNKMAKTTKENDVVYYILPFKATNEFEPSRKKIENNKTDEKLIGTWYKENKKSGYGYTFTFNEDGTFDIIYSDVSYTGFYTAENGKCTYNLVMINDQAEEVTFDYSFIDDDLVINVNNYTSRLKKTDNPYAFESTIK